MTRTPLGQVACSIARATDLFGDAWTALIMRDVITGVTRFDDLARDLGISRKVLAARLARLVEEGVLTRERYQDHPPREHYRATAKGRSCTRSCWPSWRGATAGTPVPKARRRASGTWTAGTTPRPSRPAPTAAGRSRRPTPPSSPAPADASAQAPKY
ncbi:winged helix-turn-helix transcriptional regulator [Actinomadura madurae]|uniref:winged helix-turn-helix transcriptional regulator n=1 Tax=Actinomadura madurae TaxID=1993 RepID=UPI0020D1F654|nr:helix-turn-helix domain-containing protein [Actinomadura madurae]MCP9949142.1 helix-turn-helix transcriptional regulator [Actinomadura madurae]MCP9965911.1 helix-turn-helix transcriptional regulator [Actinomadura madurae]MCP9978385.1 helix-turn-helix transcriptional regulator [Actinomadura madurae]MCQ0010093.1 helix-turn-helix transcriptional regulator [Actinomadura madurae]MCQ0014592.1 helix-turn-helix transcriptional regulator [Actinomadura madurae]